MRVAIILALALLTVAQAPIYMACRESGHHTTWQYIKPLIIAGLLAFGLGHTMTSGRSSELGKNQLLVIALAIGYVVLASYVNSLANQCPRYRKAEQLAAVNTYNAVLTVLFSIYQLFVVIK